MENQKALAAEQSLAARTELTAHTPGPWKVQRSPVTRQVCIMSDTTWICGQIQSDNETRIDTSECVANARLIAAAPDMLAALNIALHDYTLNDSAARVVEAAIAKATGAT